MKITEGLIKQYTDDITYRRGVQYYRDENVGAVEVEFDELPELHTRALFIEGIVYSADGFNSYSSGVMLIPSLKEMRFHCTCRDFEDHRSSKHRICKHLVALLLEYEDNYQQDVLEELEFEASPVDSLIREIRDSSHSSEDYKRDLKLEIKYIHARYGNVRSFLELKVGLEKLYIVKSMKGFLNAIERGEMLEFGKGFTYDPSKHKFNEADNRIIELLKEINEIAGEFTYQYSSFGGGSSLIAGKRIALPDKQLYKFLKYIKGRNIDAVIDEKEYGSIAVSEEELPLKFKLNMEENSIKLSQVGNIPRPLDREFKAFWYENSIYLPPEEQLRAYVPFYRMLAKGGKKVVFNRRDGEKLASYIVPALKRVSQKVTLDKQLEGEFYEIPLISKIYLDKTGDFVTASMIYNYGDIDINPLKEDNIRKDKGILIRDIEKEEGCETILRSFGFEKDNELYVMREEKDIVSFITEGLDKLQELGEVYYSNTFKNIKVYGSANLKAGVRINEENLLEFSFELEGVDRNELKDIFNALREKKKYYRLKKGGFVALEDKEIKNIADMIEYLNIRDSELLKDKILLSKYNALYMDQKIKDKNMEYVKRSKDFRELANNIKDVRDMDYALPEQLDMIMRNYQKTGFKWFKTLSYYGFGGILADEMGLGKTLQTIAFLYSEKGGKPSMVVVPTSLVYNWKSEIEKFAPELKVLVVSGSKKQREELMSEVNDNDVVITSYPLIRRDIEEYKKISFKYCILDEAQQIKNPGSINASSVKEIKAEGYFALTGTPIENSLTELWSIFDFVMPGYLMTHGKFTKIYENPIIRDNDKDVLEELNRHIRPFILRRMKKEVIKELPPKIEHKLVVEMTEEQKKLYAAYLASAKEEIDGEIKNKGFSKSKIKILSVLTRLRQICCDPSVFVEGFEGESGKLLALDDLIEESVGEGHKILLFSQFTSVLKNISDRLIKSKVKHMYLDGHTKSEDRLGMVKGFNEGDHNVFLISLKAGGTGLNLTGADTVIHFDPWWNPAVEEQATDRAHRIGQERTVQVIKLLTQGTIEEKIFKLQEKKREIIKNVMNEDENEDNVIMQMTQEELESLFT